MTKPVLLRDLSGMPEFFAAEHLQRAVWGEGDVPDPADLMMVIQSAGGLVAGAFVEGRLSGYIFAFPTRDPAVQYSHRLGVLKEARGLGLGLQLKLYQRTWCLERGISTVRWTFDPLRAANATLNIHRLAAVSNTYLVDYYGEMEGINRGIPSDRLRVDWNLSDPDVSAMADLGKRATPTEASLRIFIPDDVAKPDGAFGDALADRLQLRSALQAAFAQGLRIVDFDRKTSEYLLA